MTDSLDTSAGTPYREGDLLRADTFVAGLDPHAVETPKRTGRRRPFQFDRGFPGPSPPVSRCSRSSS